VHRCFSRFLVALLAFGLPPVHGIAFAAATADCPGIPVQVISGSAPDRALVCSGAVKAVTFLQRHGLAMKESIQVRLTDAAISDHGTHIGLYDAKAKAIEFLSFRQAVRQCEKQSPFRTLMDEALYTSFAAHELAHAIADQNFQIKPGSRIAQEYVAYVTQISTMPSQKRLEILQNYSMSAFANPQQMSLLYYELDPNAFGVKAYRHFLTLADRTAFLQAVLTGTIRLGDSPTGLR